MNKIKPYYFRLSRAYFGKLRQDKIHALNEQLEGATLKQQFDVLTKAIIQQRKLWKQREYKRHYQIIFLDLTQLDPYGIPKVTFIPKGHQTLAYPYKVRVHVKGCYNGREFTADIGGFNIVQTSRSWW